MTYNLAVALAGSEEERGDLLQKYLLPTAEQLGDQLDWGRLLTPDEWREFPPESLADLLLPDPQALSTGARALQGAIEQAIGRLDWKASSRLG